MSKPITNQIAANQSAAIGPIDPAYANPSLVYHRFLAIWARSETSYGLA